MDNENLIYWNGRPVGIEVGGRIQWFAGAPPANTLTVNYIARR